MKHTIPWLILLLLLSCGENGTDESTAYSSGRDSSPPAENEVVTFAVLKRVVLDPWRCTACHQVGSGDTVIPWGSSADEFEAEVLKRVTPGNHLSSSLYTRSADEDRPMPPPPDGPVNAAGLEYIQRYIEDLASN